MKHCAIKNATTSVVTEGAMRLLNGELVAFPTETVYGLGADATNPLAIEKVYKVKGRPYTDPLICHVESVVKAKELLKLSAREDKIFSVLADKFWPGPLTIICKTNGKVSDLCTGGTGSLGVRIPEHPIALELIRLAGVPIAAPSANIFGHVSPTTAKHVFDDFSTQDILVINGGPCNIGIESTVILLESDTITILRRGGVLPSQLILAFKMLEIDVKVNIVDKFNSDIKTRSVSPGTLIKHYSPVIPTFMLVNKGVSNLNHCGVNVCGIIDFNAKNNRFIKDCCFYFDLSINGDAQEACKNFFSTMRSFEIIPEMQTILLPQISATESELMASLLDRIYRACSGKMARIVNGVVQVVS